VSPEDHPPEPVEALVLTLCVAALTFVLWIEWVSSHDRDLFTPASDSVSVMAAEAGDAKGETSQR